MDKTIWHRLSALHGTCLLFPTVCLSGTKCDDFPFFQIQQWRRLGFTVNAHSVIKSRIWHILLLLASIHKCRTSLLQLYSHCSKRLLIWLARNAYTRLLSQPPLSVSTESRVTGEILGALFLLPCRVGGHWEDIWPPSTRLWHAKDQSFSVWKDQILLTGHFGAGLGELMLPL